MGLGATRGGWLSCHLVSPASSAEEVPKPKTVLVTSSARLKVHTVQKLLLLLSSTHFCLFLLLAGQGMRANEYPSDPAGALEAWACTRWPAAGQRVYQWSYQVSRSVQV